MSRLSTIDPAQATGLAAEIFDTLKRSAGMIPNAYLTIGTHSPEGLDAMLKVDEVVARSDINEGDLETIRLVVGEFVGCRYCIAAHSLKAKFSGLSEEVIRCIRQGVSTGSAKRDSLISFVQVILTSKGTVGESEVEDLFGAGYTERQIIEISLVIASAIFLSSVNRVNDTVVDFPEI